MLASTSNITQAGRIPMRPRGQDHSETSAHNRLLVWELLRQHGPQSRSQLRELSRMGSSTLTYVVRDLMEHNLVRPKGKRKSDTVGKKQELMEMNPDYGRFGGFFIEGSEISVTVVDAAGNEVDHRRVPYADSIDDALNVIGQYMDDLIGRGLSPDAPMAGLGFAVPGITDFRSGKIVQSWRLGLSDYDLAGKVRERWGMPLVVENDVKLASWAEAEQLGADLPESMIFLALNATTDRAESAELYGMGMSVIQHGQLQSGSHNGAGELDGLRKLIGDMKLNHKQVKLLRAPADKLDASLEPFIDEFSRLLSILVDLVDPASVVLGGSLEVANGAFFDSLNERIMHQRILHGCRELTVRPSAHGERGVAMGAAMLARRAAVRESFTNLEIKTNRK
ncbi:MAG: ROK family protein [Phycisphaerales bacterium]